MGKKEKFKILAIVIVLTAIIVFVINYSVVLEPKELVALLVGGMVFIPSITGTMISNKTNNKIGDIEIKVNNIASDHLIMKKGLDEVNENFRHKKQIMSLCQQIEIETSRIFDRYSDVNTMLRDYIISVNDVISNVIEKQYSYDFDLFDAKTFKRLIMAKVHKEKEHVNYTMINKIIFENISDKVDTNISKYISELRQIKGMENGTRRKEFKALTLDLTKKITNHSIDIYNKKEIA